jgi:EAL domain-containing protein (putative c-di-GMP-specific phosphodiesterase class I)
MTACSRCTSLPNHPPITGTLFLAPPLAHTQAALCKSFVINGIPFEEPSPSIVAISLLDGRLERVVSAMGDCLGESEKRDTRALILPERQQPTLSSILSTQSAASLMANVQERWLVEMIRDRRLTTHFQPIIRVDDLSKVYAYECLLRGRMEDGSLVAPTRMYDVAREAQLLSQLDRAARLTSIREAIAHRIRERLFINFNPSSIYDPTFCLESTISAIHKAGIDPDRIVFEVVESDKVEFDLLGIMATYRKAGFRIALDDLGAGYGSLNLLSSLRPDVVKLDMWLVRDVDHDPYKAGITSKLLEMARKLGIETVAEGIESPGELEWFRDHGVDYVQGYFIARPASPPPLPSSACQSLGHAAHSAS